MNQEKYIGMDVHDATISAAVKNAQGKLLMECVLETKAAAILEFIQGLRGTPAVTFEELVTRSAEAPRQPAGGLRSTQERADEGWQPERSGRCTQLAELLRTNQVKAVYHGKHGIRNLRELGQSYSTLTKDSTRVMNRIPSVYRSWAVPCAGTSVYSRRHRADHSPACATNRDLDLYSPYRTRHSFRRYAPFSVGLRLH